LSLAAIGKLYCRTRFPLAAITDAASDILQGLLQGNANLERDIKFK
jgi:hypothetical protein